MLQEIFLKIAREPELAKFDFPSDFQFSIQGERAMHIKVIKWLEQKRRGFGDLMILDDPEWSRHFYGDELEFHLAPEGWFYQADRLMARQYENWNSAVEDGQAIFSPAKVSEAAKAMKTLDIGNGPAHLVIHVLTQNYAPNLSRFAEKMAFGQESVELARVAIALERYHLALGHYPDSLEALSPRYIPKLPPDIVNGQPLRYRLKSDGWFVLYSVGWNERDDGGVPFKTSSTQIDMARGDWVWCYPEK
ncbi:MAG: hypothetical protein ACREFR_05685 [Limisphaerales bacterium]